MPSDTAESFNIIHTLENMATARHNLDTDDVNSVIIAQTASLLGALTEQNNSWAVTRICRNDKNSECASKNIKLRSMYLYTLVHFTPGHIF